MEKIPYSKFKYGQRVACKIKEQQINDAKISIDDDGTLYICHNNEDADGAEANNKLGYEFSWKIFNKYQDMVSDHDRVADLIFLDRSIEDVQEGDVVIYGCWERKVLGICGEVVFLSGKSNDDICTFYLTKYELKQANYTIKQDTPPTPPTITEVTLQEVADKMGVPVEQLRIKE